MNDVLHHVENKLCQKSEATDDFLGIPLTGDISGTRNTTKQIKCFFGHTLYEQLFGIYRQGQFWLLIFGIFMTKVSSSSFSYKMVIW